MREHTRHLMGTGFWVTVPDAAPATAVGEVFDWLAHVERRFSTFRDGSVISCISRGEIDRDDAPADVRHVLAVCDELEAATGGRFRAVRDGAIDPAGYVKGWSVDESALILRSAGIDSFSIYAGGDILCAGPPPSGDRWRVGIRHPNRPDDAVAAVIAVDGGAVATSGGYYRGEHVDGATSADLLGVTVTGPRLGIADALATAIYSDGARSLDFMTAFPGYGVLLLDANGTMRTTPDVVTAHR